jgi:vacuolar-type H+-ATPase subunit I/STV1
MCVKHVEVPKTEILHKGKFTYLVDGSGVEVPDSRITEMENLQNETIETLVEEAAHLQARILDFKQRAEKDLKTLLDLQAEEYGEEWQGNATLYNFGKTLQIVRKNKKRKGLDTKVNLAVQKISTWLESVSDDENLDVVSIVRKLTKVDDRGQYDRDSLRQLLDVRVQRNAALFEEAKELIRNSEIVVGTKLYYKFSYRDEDGEFQPILLDFAAL